MSSEGLIPYRLHSRVSHSCPLTGLLRTAYFQELHSFPDRTHFQGRLDGYMIITTPFFILKLAN